MKSAPLERMSFIWGDARPPRLCVRLCVSLANAS